MHVASGRVRRKIARLLSHFANALIQIHIYVSLSIGEHFL